MPAPLRALAPDLWVADRPQTFYGLPVGTRMTVIRLPGDRLLLFQEQRDAFERSKPRRVTGKPNL